jgi:hypothetical protein
MIMELRNDDVGRYAVFTATGSEYALDLDRRTLTRKYAAVPPLFGFSEVPLVQLRLDGVELELLMLEHLEVGYPARYWIQVRADHITTLRTTSLVTRIDPRDQTA